MFESMSMRFLFLSEILCSFLRGFLKAYVPVGKILGLTALLICTYPLTSLLVFYNDLVFYSVVIWAPDLLKSHKRFKVWVN